jgi:predicted nucleic acid-binding Zn ribbon protein
MSEHSYRCDLCGARFETDEALREHWQSTHEAREPIGAVPRA